MSCHNEIQIVQGLVGYGFSGNKAFVSKSHTHIGNGCTLQPSKKIEILDWILMSVKLLFQIIFIN